MEAWRNKEGERERERHSMYVTWIMECAVWASILAGTLQLKWLRVNWSRVQLTEAAAAAAAAYSLLCAIVHSSERKVSSSEWLNAVGEASHSAMCPVQHTRRVLHRKREWMTRMTREWVESTVSRVTRQKGLRRRDIASTRVIPPALKDNFSSLALQFSSSY